MQQNPLILTLQVKNGSIVNKFATKWAEHASCFGKQKVSRDDCLCLKCLKRLYS